MGASGQATTPVLDSVNGAGPADAVRDRLDDPRVAEALTTLLDHADLLAVLVSVQIARRAGNYGITRPAREVLYTGVERSARYKAKNFIDTVVYRGGDALSAWLYAALQSIGLTLSAIAFLAVPMTCLWAWVSYRLGRRQAELAADERGGRARNPI